MRKQRKNCLFFLLPLFILWSASTIIPQESEEDPFDLSFEELMKVKISTAARVPEELSSIPASVVLVTRDEIEKYGYRSLEEILINISGLYGLSDYSEPGLTFGVRGFWTGVPNSNMIILVNGVQQVYDFESNYPLKKIPIPVEAIDRIEVVRGPMSVFYGSGAFFGVINIFTNGGENKPFNMISSSYGSDNTRKIFLRVQGKDQKSDLRYTFNASLNDTDGIDIPISSMMTDPNNLAGYNISPDHRTRDQLGQAQKYFNFNGQFKSFYLDLSYNDSQQDIYFLAPAATDGHYNRFTATNIAFGWRQKINSKITLDGKITYLQSRQNTKYNFQDEHFYGVQEIKSDTIEAEFNAFIDFSKYFNIKTGLSYRAVLDVTNNYDLPSFGTPSLQNNHFYLDDHDDIVTRAIYAQATFKPIPNLELIAGLRLEQVPTYRLGADRAGGTPHYSHIENTFREDDIEAIPRFAILYKFPSGSVIKFLYGRAIKRPSFFQVTQNYLGDRVENLEPERIRTFEFNYIGSITSNVTLNTSLFINTLDNLITRVVFFDEENNYTTWSANAGEMVTRGLEIAILTKFTQSLTLELNATIQNTTDNRPGYDGIKTAYSPSFLGYVKAVYKAKNITLSLNGHYIDRMESFWDETIQNPTGAFGNRIAPRVPAYFNLDANLRIDNFPLKGIYFNLKLINILDEEIRYPTFTNNLWADRGTLGYGRSFLLSMGWKF